METLWQDIRYGARQLLRSPGFTSVAVLTLALGIGANTAIFSVVNAVLLRPLPFPEPDQLVLITENNLSRGWTSFAVSPANYLDWQRQAQTLQSMASFRGAGFNVSGGTEPERVIAAQVSASFFNVLGVSPLLGRTFTEEEDRPGHGRVVVLGHGFWQTHFAGDPQIVGKTVLLSGESYEVIGVMPPDFRTPGQTQVWAPAAFTERQVQQRGSHYINVIARLKPEVSLEQARAELVAVAKRLEAQYPETNTGWSTNVNTLHQQVVGSVERPLKVLLAAVGFVLVIACANVANLLLARAAGRQREIAIRTALGAGRLRLVRQLLTESVLLGLAGGALGLLLAFWGIDLLRALNPGTIPRASGIGVDRWVLLFTTGVSLLTGFLFGLAPALACSHMEVGESLKEGGRTASVGRGRQRLRQGLVVVETALALVLLVGSALLLRSFARLQGVDPGFRADNLVLALVNLPQSKYPTDAQEVAFYRQVLERVRARPHVLGAAVSTTPPLSGSDFVLSFRTEAQEGLPPQDLLSANYGAVSADYFRVLGIPLLEGRAFTNQDVEGMPRVAVINQTMARRIFPNQSPIGKRIRIGVNGSIWREIVGVVGDVRHYELGDEPTMQMYEPYSQQSWPTMMILVKTESEPHAFVPMLRSEVLAVDKDQPLGVVRTGEEILAQSVAQPRFRTVLLGLFAFLAALLAAVGIYGLMAYSVLQRTHEIGVRRALGAQPRDIIRLLLRQGMALMLVGLAAGLAGAFVLTRFLEGMLFGVTARDPMTFGGVPLLLAAVALLACWMPARRAARVDPMVALRYE